MEIEQGISIPKKRNNNPSKWLSLVERMTTGNSVVVRNRGAANALAYVIRYHGGKASIQKLPSDDYRVWRTE